MSDETTFCPDCAIERGGWSSSTEKCQHHKTVDVISTLTKDLATSRRACEESGLAYETLAEEHARSENLAFHYAKEARELEAERDALRLALDTATRERDDIAAWAESWMKRVAAAERERDEARDSLGKAAALAMIPLARGEHFKDVPDTQPHAAIARIREDLNECRAERDEARDKLVGVNVLKCLLVDAEKARDEAQKKLVEVEAQNGTLRALVYQTVVEYRVTSKDTGEIIETIGFRGDVPKATNLIGFVEAVLHQRDKAREQLYATEQRLANSEQRRNMEFLVGLTVVANPLLPKGAIFIHPDTLAGKPDALVYAKKVTSALDGDGRDGFNGSGPFEE